MSAYTKGGKRRQKLERQKRGGARPTLASDIPQVVRPQTLSTRALIEPENLRWFILRVESVREEKVIRSLDLRGIPAAIPTVPKERIRRGILYRWRTPIAHGYVLVGIPGKHDIEWWDILQLNHVWSVVGYQGKPYQVPWRCTYEDNGVIRKGGVEVLLPDLEAIRIGAAKYVRVHPFVKDDIVRVQDGPFMGFEGRVEAVNGMAAKVLLSIMGRQVPVDLEVGQVEKAA